MLDAAGFDVIEAENGAAALRAAAGLDGALRLVVTDVHMPVMNGIEFAREFRLHYPAVPVLFITGRDAGMTDDPAYFDGHLLQKPFRSEAFLAAVARLLGDGSESRGRGHSVAWAPRAATTLSLESSARESSRSAEGTAGAWRG